MLFVFVISAFEKVFRNDKISITMILLTQAKSVSVSMNGICCKKIKDTLICDVKYALEEIAAFSIRCFSSFLFLQISLLAQRLVHHLRNPNVLSVCKPTPSASSK